MDLQDGSLRVEPFAIQLTRNSAARWYASVRVTVERAGQRHSALYDFGAGFDSQQEAEAYAREEGRRRAAELLGG